MSYPRCAKCAETGVLLDRRETVWIISYLGVASIGTCDGLRHLSAGRRNISLATKIVLLYVCCHNGRREVHANLRYWCSDRPGRHCQSRHATRFQHSRGAERRSLPSMNSRIFRRRSPVIGILAIWNSEYFFGRTPVDHGQSMISDGVPDSVFSCPQFFDTVPNSPGDKIFRRQLRIQVHA